MRITIVAFILAVLLGMASAWSLFPESNAAEKAAHDINKRDDSVAAAAGGDATGSADNNGADEDEDEDVDDEDVDEEDEEDDEDEDEEDDDDVAP